MSENMPRVAGGRNTPQRRITALVALGLVGAVLTACSYPGSDVAGENTPKQHAGSITEAPSDPSNDSDDSADVAEQAGKRDNDRKGSEDKEDKKAGETKKKSIVDLSPDIGTSYVVALPPGGFLSPSAVFGPWVQQWLVEGDHVTYREVLCTGVAVREATGTLERTRPDQVVRWIDNGDGKADDPWTGNAPTETSNAKVTDTTMRVGLEEQATTDVDGERERFREYCVEAGEDIAGFFS